VSDRVTTVRDLIRTADRRWAEQYHRCSSVPPGDPGYARAQETIATYRKLADLDKEAASAADVEAIIGNNSWSSCTCSECGKAVPAVRECGQPREYDSSTADICRACLAKALAEIDAALADPGRNA